jgi:hypothetical protein
MLISVDAASQTAYGPYFHLRSKVPALSAPRVCGIHFDGSMLRFQLVDGRELGDPLTWFPWLEHATPAQREHWEIEEGRRGVRWPDLDEDLSVASLLGLPD